MTVNFNADEVFEMGLQIERNGNRFYAEAAEAAQDEQLKLLLQDLARMESGHEDLFRQLKDSLPAGAAPELGYDPDEQTALYLRAAADTHIFNVRREDPKELVGKGTAEEILNVALQFEKDSVVFFLGLEAMVPAELGKEQVRGLVREEMSHIAALSRALSALEPDE